MVAAAYRDRMGQLEMLPNDSPDFGNHEKAVVPPDTLDSLTVRMSPGDVLFFDGYVIHGSYPNKSKTRARRAFITHYLAKGSSLSFKKSDPIDLH